MNPVLHIDMIVCKYDLFSHPLKMFMIKSFEDHVIVVRLYVDCRFEGSAFFVSAAGYHDDPQPI